MVAENRPHVVCLQEFGAEAGGTRSGPGTAANMLEEMGYRQAAMTPAGRRETRRPILTSLDVADAASVPLTQRQESYLARASLVSPHGRFAVYNVHLLGFSGARPWREGNVLDPRDWARFFRGSAGAFVARAREVVALNALLEQEETPFILCGDFNSTSNQWAYRHIANGRQDAFEIAGEGWGKTYHRRLPVVRIDYIFASEGWRVLSSDVLSTGTSDHLAVIAHFARRQ